MARFASDCTSDITCPSIFESVVMSALLLAIGRVGTSIVAQGVAGTFFSTLTRSCLHAVSVFSSGMARNVQFHPGADK